TTTTTTTTTTEEPTTSEEPTEEPTTTEEPTEEPTTTEEPTFEPPPVPEPAEQARCPPGSIFFEAQCRKIICSQGEYHAGRCLMPACPAGTVWRGKRCQPPGYLTTILEIDNVIKNKHEYQTVTENVNRVEYQTIRPYDPNEDISYDKAKPPTKLTVSTSTSASVTPQPATDCCTVKSPRICRPYPPTWVCTLLKLD
ncbi:uncharacterized protein Dvir_GJ19551, partial [Drosophila virilis]